MLPNPMPEIRDIVKNGNTDSPASNLVTFQGPGVWRPRPETVGNLESGKCKTPDPCFPL